MPNPVWPTHHLLWSTEGGGLYNSVNPSIGGLSTQPQGAVPAATLNANGKSEVMSLGDLRELLIFVNLLSFTGGTTPSFQPEWDWINDHMNAGAWDPVTDATPLWKPTAATAATKWLTWLGVSQGAAPTIAGVTTLAVPVGFGDLGRFAWTVVGAPTAVSWRAFVYGK